nr:tail fiber domain-containing protein [uncultured Psychroserpens sp.]
MKKLITLKTIIFIFALANISLIDAQVGVGTTTPAYTFQVINNGNIGATTLSESTNSGTDGVALTGYNLSTLNGYNAVEGATNGTFSGVFGLHIPTSGTTGNGVYGTSNSSDAIGVFGTIPTTGTWLGFGGLFTGGLGYANGLYNISDARTKKDILQIDNALDKILNINGYTYKYDFNKYNSNTSNNNQIHYGFMAQNVKEFLPHAVATKSVRFASDYQKSQSDATNNIVSEMLNVVDYTAIIPVLVQAMKEQQSIINDQNSKIQDLEAKLLLLESKVNAIIESQN